MRELFSEAELHALLQRDEGQFLEFKSLWDRVGSTRKLPDSPPSSRAQTGWEDRIPLLQNHFQTQRTLTNAQYLEQVVELRAKR